MIDRLIIILCKIQMKKIRRYENTDFMYIRGDGKDFPIYLLFTDDVEFRSKMKRIY